MARKSGMTIDLSEIEDYFKGAEAKVFNETLPRAMNRVGLTMQDHAQQYVPVKTGHLQASITHQEGETSSGFYSDVGTNVEYAPYIEFGTGPRGDPSVPHTPEMSWVYRDDDGEFHVGVSQPARPYLRPALNNHVAEYKDIIMHEVMEAFRK